MLGWWKGQKEIEEYREADMAPADPHVCVLLLAAAGNGETHLEGWWAIRDLFPINPWGCPFKGKIFKTREALYMS